MNFDRAFKAAGLVAALTLATNVLGFVRELFMARAFGASAAADAFITAFTLVSSCFLVFTAGTVQAVFMPRYQGLIGAAENAAARRLFFVSMCWLAALLTCLALVVGLGARPLVAIVAPGFDPSQQELTAALARTLAPMVLFVGAGSLLQSVAHAHGRFFGPALVPLLNNLVLIASLAWLAGRLGIEALAWAYLAGALLWWLVLVPVTRPHLRGERASVDPGRLREMLLALGPLLLLLAADQVSALVQKGLVSGLGGGSIAALNYAAKLEGLPVGIFSMAIATVFFPALVDAIGRRDHEAVRRRFLDGLSGILHCAVPASVFLCLEAEQIVRVLFERGAFGTGATRMTADALVYYSLGLLPQGLIVYLNRVYFAAKDTKRPMVVGVISVVFHIAFCWVAVDRMGYLGIALGTSLYALMYVVLLAVGMRRVVPVTLLDLPVALWRALLAGLVLAGFYWRVDFGSSATSMGVAVAIGGAIYAGTLLVLREPLLGALRAGQVNSALGAGTARYP